MPNIKLIIQYDGTNYQGWQIQQNQPHRLGKEKTIQGIIERVLEQILQEHIRVIAAGRTDAGVHALGQVANFKTKSKMPIAILKRALNGLLPKDIVIADVKEARPDFNARFDAISKLYRYQILSRDHSSALGRFYQNHIPYKLNLALMKKEAKVLVGRHDFKSFQASDKIDRNTVRCIKRISIRKKGPVINIALEADGFLYNMVRNMVGTLIDIGRGKLEPGGMKKILLAKDRRMAGPTAPAKGLCLVKVRYGVRHALW